MAGFNQGFNIAEAVNFAMPHWLRLGRECVNNYSLMKRFPVFSHDEFILNMSTASQLDASLLNLVYDDLLGMVKTERNLRREALDNGITRSKNVHFNTLPDDERQCHFCKTTCYLSGLTCECDDNKLVCLQHLKELCKRCPSTRYTLKYTFKLDELVTLLKNLEDKLNRYEKLNFELKRAVNALSSNETMHLESNDDNRLNLKELIELRDKSIEMNITNNSKTMKELNENLDHALNLQEKINSLLNQTGQKQSMTFNDFKILIDNLNDLNIDFDRKDDLIDLYEDAKKLIDDLKQQTINQTNRKLIDKLSFLNLDEYLDESTVNRTPNKRKRINRLSNNLISPTIRNSAF